MIKITLLIIVYNCLISLFSKSKVAYCGLVGFSGVGRDVFNLDKIKLLLMLNQERGKDNYGYFTPSQGIKKDSGKIEEALIKKDLYIQPDNTFIGHVRSSTVGNNTAKNAHPFHRGNIILAMNGTLTNYWLLCKDYKWSINDFDVDSDVLCAMINHDQTKEPLSKILGGCALIYTDTTTGKLYCYRNLDRPLYRGNLNGSMYISSLENPLSIIGCKDVQEFKENILYEIFNGSIYKTYPVKRAIEEVKINPAFSGNIPVIMVNFQHMQSSELVGKYLTPRRTTIHKNNSTLFEEYYYEVVESSQYNQYDITVLDNNGKKVTVSKYTFKEEYPIIDTGCYTFTTRHIIYDDQVGTIFAEKGDLVFIKKRLKDILKVKNIVNDKECTINIREDMLRFASEAEVTEARMFLGLTDDTEAPKDMSLDGELNYDLFKQEGTYPTHPNSTINSTESFTKYAEEVEQAIIDKEKSNKPSTCYEEDNMYDDSFVGSYEDLVEHTIEGINYAIDKIKELELLAEVAFHIENIELFISNFNSRENEFFIEEEDIADEELEDYYNQKTGQWDKRLKIKEELNDLEEQNAGRYD
jgi:hypothetical protein